MEAFLFLFRLVAAYPKAIHILKQTNQDKSKNIY